MPKPKHLTTPALLLASLLAGCMSNAEFRAADKARGDALCKDHGGMTANEGPMGYLPNTVYHCADGTRA